MRPVRINDLARELGVKSQRILDALPEVGVETRKPRSSSLDWTTADRIREHFKSESARGMNTASQSKRQILIDKGLITPAQSSPIRKSKIIPRRPAHHLKQKKAPSIYENIVFTDGPKPAEAPDTRIPCQQCGAKVFPHAMDLHLAKSCPAKEGKLRLPDINSTSFPFVLLPPGVSDLRKVFEHYRKQTASYSHGFFDQVFEWKRLEQMEKLRPMKTHFGAKLWFGYIVYEFEHSRRVVLESPVKGNATYIISGDWKKMIRLPKATLRSKYRCPRFIHVGDWFSYVSRALRAP